MDDLQRLVAESLARNGFAVPQPRPTEGQTLATRLAASPEHNRACVLEPAPLPEGF